MCIAIAREARGRAPGRATAGLQPAAGGARVDQAHAAAAQRPGERGARPSVAFERRPASPRSRRAQWVSPIPWASHCQPLVPRAGGTGGGGQRCEGERACVCGPVPPLLSHFAGVMSHFGVICVGLAPVACYSPGVRGRCEPSGANAMGASNNFLRSIGSPLCRKDTSRRRLRDQRVGNAATHERASCANICRPVPKVAAGVLFAGQPRHSRHSLLPSIRADSCANRSTRRIGT
jgi:hypothetical protein